MLTNSFWNKRDFTHLLSDNRIFIIVKVIQISYSRNLEILIFFLHKGVRKEIWVMINLLIVDIYISKNLKFIFQDHTSFIPTLTLPVYLQLKDENGFSI